MNHVIRHIEYLVHRHDCVVLPKWGAFIADYQPACFDETLGLMYPPRRELSFCASVDYNDGLLASSIARKEAISFARASRIVEEELAAMKHQLEFDGEISLGKVGRFIRQDNVSVIFEPSGVQSHVGNCGFEALSIKPLLSKVKEEAITAGRIEASHRGRLSRIGLRAVRAAAAVAVAVAVSVALLRPSFNRNDDMASIAPVMSQKSSQASIMPSIGEERTLNIMVPDESRDDVAEMQSSETVDAVADVAVEAVPAVRLDASDRYCLVVASLQSMSQAEKFVKEHSDVELGILEKDGKYRVYAATGSTTNEALLAKDDDEIGRRFADAWVCSMR